ncbi:hypothetical protein EV361DRAFT_871877 [Lentinula raphanica]|nr:hypothetical protein EV361DRAFT_871877 [Lentinula raphanica]
MAKPVVKFSEQKRQKPLVTLFVVTKCVGSKGLQKLRIRTQNIIFSTVYLSYSLSHSIMILQVPGPYRLIYISIAVMLAVAYISFGRDRPLIERVHQTHYNGVWFSNLLGPKIFLIYLLTYLVCLFFFYPEAPVPEDLAERRFRPSRSVASPVTVDPLGSSTRQTIPIPNTNWAIDVRFPKMTTVPHVVFEDYHLDFGQALNRKLAKEGKPNDLEVVVLYDIYPAGTTGHQTVNNLYDATVTVVHTHGGVKSTYLFAVEIALLPFSVSSIPQEIRENNTGRTTWNIATPSFVDLYESVRTSLNPTELVVTTHGNTTPFLPQTITPFINRTEFNVPIIVPVLKSMFSESELTDSGQVGPSPFKDIPQQFAWDSLIELRLSNVQILPRDYRAILMASSGLRTMIIDRPGEGYGEGFGEGYQLQAPTGIVRANQLQTLELNDCGVDIKDFIAASVVDFPQVKVLAILSRYDGQSIQAMEMGVNWKSIRTLKLSNKFPVTFIQQCRTRLVNNAELAIVDI